MKEGTILQLLISLVGLSIIVFNWWISKETAKKKEKDDIDKQIDTAKSFDDFVRIDDKLRK